MAFFGFLKSESEKIKDTNNYNKKEIIRKIGLIKNASSSSEISQLLSQVVKQLTGQQQTASEKVIDIDTRILSKIDSVSLSTAKQNVGGAVNDLINILELVVERGAYCTSQSFETRAERRERERAEKMANKYATEIEETQAEKRQKEIDDVQDKLDALIRKHGTLSDIFKECPSGALKARLGTIKTDVAGLQEELNMLINAQTIENGVEAGKKVGETATHIGQTTTINKVDMTIQAEETKKNMDDLNDLFGAAKEYISDVMGAAGSLNSLDIGDVTSLDDVTSLGNFDTTANAAPTRTPFGKGNSSIGSSNSSFGDNGYDTTARDKQREIQREIDVIEKQIDAYNSKIQDAQDEINEIATELAPLIKQFEAASPLQRPRIDSEIMGLKRKLKAIQHNIKTYEQEKQNREIALGTKQMELGHADIAAMNEKGGRSIDVQGIKDAAMGVREDTIKANEKHSEFTDIESVANSVGVEKESFDDLGVDSFETEDIDSHKHDDLKELLGMI